ncbi:bactofilin family protein [Halococcoides cellulosivorans]|uniref:DUF7305 domain-containing protein n=1 Tax=Halococcoides cellulosivorans TaxID=1679096 RepID=A0A2R4WXG7_9EURY|nr:polymer-forming cytoskeletal protein [Halococcoides cellulosivorans]AWB26237.1 hypothetical protein HARCEL1_00130 [Halococcoides cellulosivorans]
MNNHYKFASGDRAVSPVLGTVFVFAFVVLVAGGIVLAGASAVDLSKEQAETKQVRLSMQELADSASSVAGEDGRSRQIDLSRAGSRIDATDGAIRIAIDNGTETWSAERTLGSVGYERSETTIAYQGGGVWEKAPDSDSVSVVSPPPIDYRTRGEPTLSVPVIRVVGGSQAGDSLTVESAGSAAALIPSSKVPLEPGSTVNLTVESAYYRGWGQVFERQLGSAPVSYNATAKTVTVSLVRGDDVADSTIRSSVYSQNVTSLGGVSNHGAVGSYDSTGATGSNGAARFEDDISLTNNARIGGELHIDGNLTTDKEFSVTGPARVGGTAHVQNENTFEDSLSVGEDLIVSGGGANDPREFQGPVRVGGTFTGLSGRPITDTHAHDDVSVAAGMEVGSSARIGGTLTADGTVRLLATPTFAGETVGGDVIGGSEVYVDGGSVGGSVFTDGDAHVVDGTVKGSVEAGGTVHLHKSGTVDGPIRAAGDVIVYGGQHSTLDRIEAGGDVVLHPGASVTPKGDEVGVERIVVADKDVVLKESSSYYGTRSASLQADVYAANADGSYAVHLEGSKTQIKGDVYVHDATNVKVGYSYDDYRCTSTETTDKRITGCIAEEEPLGEQVSPPPSLPAEAPAAPQSPTIYSEKRSVNDIVAAHEHLQTNPDTSPIIQDGEIASTNGCSGTCTLTAGQYALDRIDIAEGDELVMDTSGGPIEIYVTEEIQVGAGDPGRIHVAGNDRVTIYHEGHETRLQANSRVTTESGSARQLWIYQTPDPIDNDPDFMVGSEGTNAPSFTGVFYGYNPDGPDTRFRLDDDGTVYGAVLGEMAGIVEHGAVYYDETLASATVEDDSDSTSAEVVYLQSEDRSVTVG